MLDLAITWLPIIGALIFGLGVAIWYGGGAKTYANWIGLAGIVILATGFSLHLQKIINEAADSKEPAPKAESTDRPWIAVELGIMGPLAYDRTNNKSGGWHVPIRHMLRNTGNSPAFNVQSLVTLKPFLISVYPKGTVFKDNIPQGTPLPGTNIAEELKKFCDGHAEMSEFFRGGRTFFKEQTAQGVTDLLADPVPFEGMTGAENYSGILLLMFCVTYRSGPESRLHQTGEAFLLGKRDGKIDLAGEIIAPEQLSLIAAPMGGSIAN